MVFILMLTATRKPKDRVRKSGIDQQQDAIRDFGAPKMFAENPKQNCLVGHQTTNRKPYGAKPG
jgi:hypothetical protein